MKLLTELVLLVDGIISIIPAGSLIVEENKVIEDTSPVVQIGDYNVMTNFRQWSIFPKDQYGKTKMVRLFKHTVTCEHIKSKEIVEYTVNKNMGKLYYKRGDNPSTNLKDKISKDLARLLNISVYDADKLLTPGAQPEEVSQNRPVDNLGKLEALVNMENDIKKELEIASPEDAAELNSQLVTIQRKIKAIEGVKS
jgi:hypothetical protein